MFDKKISMSFTTKISVNVKELYNFHIDTHNLPKISPPWIEVRIVSISAPLVQGSEIKLDIKRFGLWQRWHMQIAKLKDSELVFDKALKSPFAFFSHYHRFQAIDANTSILRDELAFSLPLYPFSLIFVPFIRHDIKKMFNYRHQQTKKILEKNNV